MHVRKNTSAFALAAGAAVFIAASMAHAQTSAWTATDKSDVLHQISFKEFRLEGRFLAPPHQSSLSAPVLVLHCQPGRHDHRGTKSYAAGKLVEGWIATGAALDSHAGPLGTCASVEYRRDDMKLQLNCWGSSTDHSAVFLSDVDLNNLLYGHLMPHKEWTNSPQVRKIILGVSEYLAAQIQIEFDLPESTEVADACGVIEHKR
jgi:hypothetical protein